MREAVGIIVAILCGVAGLSAATQFIAATFNYQTALGAPLIQFGETAVYAPWAVIGWTERWADGFPKPFAIARLIVLSGFVLGFLIAALALQRRLQMKPFGKDAWAKFGDIEAAGLFAEQGTLLGKFDGEILAYDGPGHQILIGASRSGKGRGHVVPTLLVQRSSSMSKANSTTATRATVFPAHLVIARSWDLFSASRRPTLSPIASILSSRCAKARTRSAISKISSTSLLIRMGRPAARNASGTTAPRTF